MREMKIYRPDLREGRPYNVNEEKWEVYKSQGFLPWPPVESQKPSASVSEKDWRSIDKVLLVIETASKFLNKVSREDLEDACKILGLEVSPAHTKPVLLDLLKKKVADK